MGKMRLFDCYIWRGGYKTEGLLELCNYIKQTGQKMFKIADVGCYAGESSMILYNEFKQTATIIAIDNWNPSDLAYTGRTNLAEELKNAELNLGSRIRGLKHISKTKGDITNPNLLQKIPNQYFDFAYVDTSYDPKIYLEHIHCFVNKVKKGGFIAGSGYGYSQELTAMINEEIEPDKTFNHGEWIKKI